MASSSSAATVCLQLSCSSCCSKKTGTRISLAQFIRSPRLPDLARVLDSRQLEGGYNDDNETTSVPLTLSTGIAVVPFSDTMSERFALPIAQSFMREPLI